jgi:MoxR-like ATPase
VLLIDEIDKADIEFPNDLLQELDRMEFHVYETGETIKADSARSSSSPPTTKRNCRTPSCAAAFFHFINFPDAGHDARDRRGALPGLKGRLVQEALEVFFDLRDVPGLKKKPSTSELIDWLKLLLNEDDIPETLREKDPVQGHPAALWRIAQERAGRALLERLAFMHRRESR